MLRPLPTLAAVSVLVSFCNPATLGADLPLPDALTELSAGNWGAAAQGASAAVYDDTSRRKVGSASLRFETDGCFDTWLWAPLAKNANWDFLTAGSGGMALWVYTENSNIGFQGPSPWIHLCTTPDDYFAYRPSRDFLNDARGRWVHVSVPLNGNAAWTQTTVGAPSLSNINYIEIHGDTWDCNFTLWIDDLRFDVQLAPPEALVAVAGNSLVALEWKPFNDLSGQFDHYAIYRTTYAFSNVTGLTSLATLSGINNTTYTDHTAVNGTHYYYAVTAVFTGGGETRQVEAVGPRTPRSETDLQIASISRTPRYPRYYPIYTGYWVTEPSGFGPYWFTAATGLGGGQSGATQRWPKLGDPVTYIATVRNRGTNTWSGTLGGTWRVDGGVVGNPGQSVSLAPGDVTTFAYTRHWDEKWHEVEFTLNIADARSENNRLAIHTKSAPFLTYVDLTYLENFRESTPNYPQAATDDMIDWLQRHAARMNQMFVTAGSLKRVHYDVLQALHDHDPDPSINRQPFGIFPFRYRGGQYGDPRSPGYYHPDVDIDYGLCHELSHQLGLVDIYRLDLPASRNEVSGTGYTAIPGLMHGCSDFYSQHSARGMTRWADIVHGYYGQYMYCMPTEIRLRILDYYGDPLPGATITMYQMVERPGQGQIITGQVKAQGVSNQRGEWTLPNVPIDPGKVPPTYAGDELHANPFGYLAVVGTNGLLHFKIEYDQFVDYAWLDVTEVNLAYWQGQTNLAVFDRQVSVGGGLQNYPPADMAELNAADWTAWAQQGTINLFDDTARKQVGSASIRVETTGGFDNHVRYPTGILARWDLSAVERIRFWAYAENPNAAFQNHSPWLRLGSFQDGYFEWRPSWDILNRAINQWREFVVPIDGNATWTRTTHGTPELSRINYFQLHADTWGYGFTLWLDGVRFDPPPEPHYGDMNCDEAVNLADIDPFVLALSGPAAYYAQYPDCAREHADCNRDGTVDFADIDAFVALLGG